MTDYEILKFLGLDIRDQSIIFYDEDLNEHILEYNEIIDISIEQAYIPFEKKIGFWLEKLFLQRRYLGIFNSKPINEDYRNIYELEIELTNYRVLSRKVRNADIYECKEFISEINELINSQIMNS